MSRSARPKQFIELTGPTTLFQQTLQRVADKGRYTPALVLTNSDYRFIVAEQALELGQDLMGTILEPVARNTAVAIAAAAAYAMREAGPEAVLHVLPSDHAVDADESYWQAVEMAAATARAGHLVTFGITATRPETGYGYIQNGASIGAGVYQVARFIEKPDLERAEAMLAEGGFTWNSGMFMIKASVFLDECQRLSPDTYAAALGSVEDSRVDLDFVRLAEEPFSKAPNISVDYAVFEKTEHAAVVPVSFAWSDLGAWDAVWKLGDKDEAGNVSRGEATLSNSSNMLVVTDKAHVVVEGLDDVAVIASEDAVYVGKLSEAQKVGPLVKTLRANPNTQALTEIHKTAYRPWGGYSSILSGERFQVKRLFVKPGMQLSLQRHHHRAEHWIVVRGTAEVTIDGDVTMLTENESIYLPLGCTHRLANPGKILLELIEVQTGAYLGEDDIVRIEDVFGRA
ncbi:mannose-1-phosphate guanylyltransferase [Devosia pacifica]|uniref:mannose-1-phosphate guanylyltransferase n=2 Tax=Devosia pacifica TaxID=1335967 RepID=A0A918SBB2_9HYPH|nr:mannose-1-phosphate guanylyltransferase [Devosia pacifica]